MQVIYTMEVTKMLFKIQKYFNCDYFNNKAPRRSSLKHYACRVKTVKEDRPKSWSDERSDLFNAGCKNVYLGGFVWITGERDKKVSFICFCK